MIGVNQLLYVLYDKSIDLNASSSISAWHNIVVSDDNLAWIDNGTAKNGTAYDLMEAIYLTDAKGEVQKMMRIIRDDENGDAQTLLDTDSLDSSEAKFPLERLPTKLREMAEGIMEMEGVPAVMAACAVMGAASASLGNGIEIESKADKTAYGNLFFLLDAPSGVGKSGTSERAARPLREFEKANNVKRQQQRKQLAAEIKKQERTLNTVDDDEGVGQIELDRLREELEQLKRPNCFIVGDTTTEKLASICADNGGATASFSGEARGIVQVLSGRYDKGSVNDSFYLSAFSVEPFRQERIGREGVLVDRPCLSVMWMVQPDVYGKMWSTESFFEGGLLPRFLCCRTNAEVVECSDERKVFPQKTQLAYNQVITDLLATYNGNRDQPFRVVVSQPARKIITQYANRIVARRKAKEFSDKGEPFASRWAELTWKLALVFHAVEYGSEAHLHEVTAETALSALAVVSWFSVQQINQIEEYEMNQLGMAEPKILAIASRVKKITPRMVAKAGIVKSSSVARDLMKKLEEEGLLVSDTSYGGRGRPTRHYSLPPNNSGRK